MLIRGLHTLTSRGEEMNQQKRRNIRRVSRWHRGKVDIRENTADTPVTQSRIFLSGTWDTTRMGGFDQASRFLLLFCGICIDKYHFTAKVNDANSHRTLCHHPLFCNRARLLRVHFT